MNERFFQLSEDKRNKIISSGFRVFSQYSYKNSPMSEIAAEAGISKSLLFYYFKNKKELYLFLCRYSTELTEQEMIRQKCYEKADFFDIFLILNASNAEDVFQLILIRIVKQANSWTFLHRWVLKRLK